MDDWTRYLKRVTSLICLEPRNRGETFLFPAEPWRSVLMAAAEEGWKHEHQLSDYNVYDEGEPADQCLTSSWDFAEALSRAAERVPDDYENLSSQDEFYLGWFVGRAKSLLVDLIRFAKSSGGFDVRWSTAADESSVTTDSELVSHGDGEWRCSPI
jgi:hypothetical protein